MSNQPTIFNITYTPYKLKITATEKEKQEHIEKRSFYDMSGGKNFLGYIRSNCIIVIMREERYK